MSGLPYRIQPLDANHIRTAFSSGEEALDAYLKTQAGQEIRRGYAGVFVAVEQGESAVQGYYTLSASSVELSSLPDAVKTVIAGCMPSRREVYCMETKDWRRKTSP